MPRRRLTHSPKRAPDSAPKGASDYYAAFSEGFVAEVLTVLGDDVIVLDPWNGAGTTTHVAKCHGLTAYGYDANPAAVVAASARLMSMDTLSSVDALATHIAHLARESDEESPDTSVLRRWLTRDSANRVVRLERSIARLLIQAAEPPVLVRDLRAAKLSSLAAYFYLALFKAVRSAVARFITSNPTWIRSARTCTELRELDMAELIARFSAAQRSLAALALPAWRGLPGAVSVGVASSRELPLPDGSVQAVVTSPPYCTRIDYVMATLPEIAVLGGEESDVTHLRREMIGTPTITGCDSSPAGDWGATAQSFLRNVRAHRSQASAGYYSTQYRQYFSGMLESLKEIDRVTREGGLVTMVIQDSWYKEVHLDLPAVIKEMSEARGWKLTARDSFAVRPTKASIHPHSRRYRSTFTATEVATTFRT